MGRSPGSLQVEFLNVGQGDATLVMTRDPDFCVMVDGGRSGDIKPHLPFLRELRQIDLMVGTHGDADHIEGLCTLLKDDRCPTVKKALLPPALTPTGELVGYRESGQLMPEQSPFAAHALDAEGLEGVLRPLEDLVGEAELVPRLRGFAEELKARHPETSGRRSLWEAGFSERSAELNLPRITETINAVSEITGVLDIDALELAENARGLLPLESFPAEAVNTFRAAAAVAEDVGSLTNLERLINLLKEADILWEVQAAPQIAMGEGSPVEAWHVAPTLAYAKQIAKKLKPVRLEMLRGVTGQTDLPTEANRVSHVIAFRRGDLPGVMITGDSGFQEGSARTPESMSQGWESTLDWARLITVAHHGGRSGHFKRRLQGAVEAHRPGEPLDLYLSVGFPNEGAPPSDGFDQMLEALSATCPELTLRMSAVPRVEALRTEYRERIEPKDENPGPDRVSLCNGGSRWHGPDPDESLKIRF